MLVNTVLHALTTEAWLITDGMARGSATELGRIFHQNTHQSEYGEMDIPLIGICPWGILSDRHQLQGIHVSLLLEMLPKSQSDAI